jgi:hypothetical protein
LAIAGRDLTSGCRVGAVGERADAAFPALLGMGGDPVGEAADAPPGRRLRRSFEALAEASDMQRRRLRRDLFDPLAEAPAMPAGAAVERKLRIFGGRDVADVCNVIVGEHGNLLEELAIFMP